MSSKDDEADDEEDEENPDGVDGRKLHDGLAFPEHPMWRDAASMKELAQLLADVEFYNNVGA
jgi:hypothetical protein